MPTETEAPSATPAVVPPVARRVPKVDVVRGERREDPYFWMRDKNDPEVRAYLEAENAHTDAVLRPTEPLQQALYTEMLARIKETDLSVPYPERGYFYYSRTQEKQQYPIHCRKRGGLDAPEDVFLDLNLLAEGKAFMALGAAATSDDGRLLAYSTDDTGFRQYTLFVKDLVRRELLPLQVERVVTVAWAADGRTLFYTVEDEQTKRPYRLYRRMLDDAEPELLYEEPDERFNLYVGRARSGAVLFLASASHTTSEVRFLRADQPRGEWRLIAPREADHEYEVYHHGEDFYVRTNDRGRNFRLVRAAVADPRRENWVEVVPHRADVMLEAAEFFARHYVLQELRDGLPRLRVVELATGGAHEVAFPEPAYSIAPTGNAEFETTQFRYNYQSPTTPPSVFDYDMDRREATLLKQTEVLGGYDPTQYACERVHATASDGTRIPISLVYRKGFRRDGSQPAHLYGYGSYGLSMPAGFSSNRVSLLDRGFVSAIAHVRGGGELGKPWHDQGRMLNKRNTFTDFIAAAEFLIGQGFTSPARLVIEGGSAGGLLMGAVSNMRPELFKAVVSKVPFVDVLNTMLDETLPLTVGEFEEWGNPKLEAEYDYIRSYCPYSNLEAKAYPAMLVKTSFNDSQVMYWEPAKYVAKLRTLKTDSNPLLLKTNLNAGHGGASGRYDYLREIALDYAFVLTQVDAAG